MAGVEKSLSWAGWWGQESLAQHWLSHMPELGPGLGSGRTWSQGRAQGQGHIPVSIHCASQLFPTPTLTDKPEALVWGALEPLWVALGLHLCLSLSFCVLLKIRLGRPGQLAVARAVQDLELGQLSCLPLSSVPNPPASAGTGQPIRPSQYRSSAQDSAPHLWDLVGGDHEAPAWRALGVGWAGLGHSRLREPLRKFDSSFW